MAHKSVNISLQGSFSGSGNEELNTSGKVERNSASVIVVGEVPESDDEETLVPEEEMVISNTKTARPEVKYDSLLHVKLREKNEKFQKEVMTLSHNPYRDAVNGFSNLTRSALGSRSLVLDVASNLDKLKNDIILINNCMDRALAKSKHLPRIKTFKAEEAGTF